MYYYYGNHTQGTVVKTHTKKIQSNRKKKKKKEKKIKENQIKSTGTQKVNGTPVTHHVTKKKCECKSTWQSCNNN